LADPALEHTPVESSVAAPDDAAVKDLARRILGAAEPTWRERARQSVDVDERLLEWAIARPEFKTNLFRFVDVLPACDGDAEVLRHLREHLESPSTPAVVRAGLRASRVPGAGQLVAKAARAGVARMARRFIAGESPAEAVAVVTELWHDGYASTVDLLGEKTLTLADSERYAARVRSMLDALSGSATTWPTRPVLDRDPWDPVPRVNVSVKPSALAPLLHPGTVREGIRQARERLDPILDLARSTGATVHLDGEHDELKDATYALLRDVGSAWRSGPALGSVVQAYRRDSHTDLCALADWSARTLDVPLLVRLVKGAYWDAETIHADAEGWPRPVWSDKTATDAHYERCTLLLVERAGDVRPAVAGHNARSLAHAIVAAERRGLPDDALELQVLFGMAQPLHAALRDLGMRVRVYAPVGELLPGMAYLVRRLLENTSNESFVRHRFTEHEEVEALIATPVAHARMEPVEPAEPSARTDATHPGPFRNEARAELRRPDVEARLVDAVREIDTRLGFDAPLIVDGEDRRTDQRLRSVDPARPDVLVCESAAATTEDALLALDVAERASIPWRRAGWQARADVLFGTASLMRRDRDHLTALVVREAGKPLAEADADVCEAIDFLEWYGRGALELAPGRELPQAPGEGNRYWYQPRGVTVVIAPWNFPLAIPTGMVSAALATGNPVVLKPAEQTPGIGRKLVELLLEAGAPPGTISYLPGVGEEIGPVLVEDPCTALVVFTGSRAVGLEIIRRAAEVQPGQRHVKRVVAEMGGKNPIVVDSDADLDEAVPAIVASAYGYAGQKCSAAARVIALDDVHDALVERLAGAVELVTVGDPADPGTLCGPLIDTDALARVRRYQDLATREGRVVVQRRDVPDHGWFAGPTLATADDPSASIARDEIFGPVLVVMRATDFDHAIALANDTDYALTAGIFSRSPARIRIATEELRAGNVYVNRSITGALVGRQPFGGYGLSGVGSKAGGPDYLLQLVEPRSSSENTVRQGFAPDALGGE
jgi:RHH-type proline utilization regulon transcriptional repressor/proline dehydrogenase/delta 1-pyrroline-5-carboxylate dehydrogenase